MFQTHNSVLNTSRSKNLYSFPKSERFAEIKKPLCSSFYDVNIRAFGQRSTSFGYGRKGGLAALGNGVGVGKY